MYTMARMQLNLNLSPRAADDNDLTLSCFDVCCAISSFMLSRLRAKSPVESKLHHSRNSPTREVSARRRKQTEAAFKTSKNEIACDSETRTRDGLGFVGNFCSLTFSFLLFRCYALPFRRDRYFVDFLRCCCETAARRTRAKASRHSSLDTTRTCVGFVCAEVKERKKTS